MKYLCWKTIIYNFDSNVTLQSRFKSRTSKTIWKLIYITVADKFKKQNRQKKDGGSITEAGQMNVWRVLDTTGFFRKTEYLRSGEEEDGRGWSAYQFSRKAT